MLKKFFHLIYFYQSVSIFLLAGTAIAVLTVVILIVKFCVTEFAIKNHSWTSGNTTRYIETFVKYFIIGVTVLVVAVPEGLPLAVTLALAYSVKVCYASLSLSLPLSLSLSRCFYRSLSLPLPPLSLSLSLSLSLCLSLSLSLSLCGFPFNLQG